MSDVLTYKGHTARIEFDAEDRIFFGRVAGIEDGVGFHGESVEELVAAFHEAVDDYVETCGRVGKREGPACSASSCPPTCASRWPKRRATPGRRWTSSARRRSSARWRPRPGDGWRRWVGAIRTRPPPRGGGSTSVSAAHP